MIWRQMHPRANLEMLGFIPSFLDENDPRPAREQFNANYVGGWYPFTGFKLWSDERLKYPEDPPLQPLFRTSLRDEEIIVYEYAWVLIRQTDGSWEVARMD